MPYPGMNTHDYFIEVSEIWRLWSKGKLGALDRDRLLRPYRAIARTLVPSNSETEY